jgi:APA family basic amino acid/polyamine antiporter
MERAQLQRRFGLATTISIVIGGVIGSGIFMKPSLMAGQLGSPELLLAVWIVAGLITLCGALTNAEVAAMYPETGGQYVFFRRMYGDFFSFLYGWAAFAVFNTAGVASIAYVLAGYVEYFVLLPRFSEATELAAAFYIPGIGSIFPLQNFGVKALTMFTVVLLTAVNYISVRSGGAIQVIFTALKTVAIIMLVAGILFSGDGNVQNFTMNSTTVSLSGMALINAFVAAMAGAFWAYDGWNNITFVAGEIRHPQKNIPLSLFFGIAGCIIFYALVNLAYLYVLPIDSIAASPLVASDAAAVIMGTTGGAFIAVLVIVSTFGTTNGNILATARVSFSMAQENRFFPFAAKVHPVFKTPGNALILHAVWTCLLVCSGSFDSLTDMLIFVSWVFYGMSAIGVFVLRYKFPFAERPYRVWGYPFVPLMFILFTVFFLGVTLYSDISNYLHGNSAIINSAFGLLLTFSGVPLYWYFRKRRN